MISSDEEFHQWLLATFREEAEEILTDISNGLIRLEKDEPHLHADLIEQVFRKTHSLKGAARAVNLRDIESVCQNIENVFSSMKRGEIHVDPVTLDLLHRAISAITSLLSGDGSSETLSGEIVHALRGMVAEKRGASSQISLSDMREGIIESVSTNSSCGDIGDFLADQPPYDSITDYPGSASSSDSDSHPGSLYDSRRQVRGSDTVRISSHKLDQLIAGSDDLLTTRLFITHRLRELENMMSTFSLWRWNYTQIEGDLHHLREITHGIRKSGLPPEVLLSLERMVEFFRFDHEFVTNLQHDLALHIRATEVDRSALESSTSGISDLIHDAVLLPISSILSPFTKIVRDYSRRAGKVVDLKIEGEDIEMDRRILETLKAPLMHLIHNCIDHGFEIPSVRTDQGKPASGLLTVRVTPHSGSKVGIEVIDDGAGIDRNHIRKTAIEKGVITERQGSYLTDEEALWLIFRSGLSTCNEVSELSGRGLGLAIVEDTVTRLGGDIFITSESQRGTAITIILPVRLATLRGMVVRSGSQTYVIPIQQVKQVSRARSDSFFMQGSRMLTRVDGDLVRVVILSHLLGVPTGSSVIDDHEMIPIITIEYGGRQIACVVDDVVRVQEIVVRPLGSLLRRVKRITGAVILGDGGVALVLDPLEIIQEAFSAGRRPLHQVEKKVSKFHILVVEDSVTSRALLQRTLEMEGYQVHTASDGMDAFAKLKDFEFDMVVSDVDMPRMSGFTLTEKIRADGRFSHLQVVLVTSLDTPQDRTHGMAVGADAYIVKSSFEKTSFLNTIKKLLNRDHHNRAYPGHPE